MKRRAVLLASGAGLIAAATRAFSQTKLPRRIAVILPGSRAGYQTRFDTFRIELSKLGYVEGRDLLIDVRWGDDRIDALAALATEALRLNPEVIVTASSAGVAAVRKTTSAESTTARYKQRTSGRGKGRATDLRDTFRRELPPCCKIGTQDTARRQAGGTAC